jgi:membrane-bound lytic murein transglycosylase D
MEKEEIRALNPQYRRDIIPGVRSKPQILKLPSIQAYAFVELEDSIASYRFAEFFSNPTVSSAGSSQKGEKIIHKVTRGETLATIGNRYGVTTSNIRKWNGLKSSKVALGKNLILYVDNGGIAVNRSARTTTAQKPVTTQESRPTAGTDSTSAGKKAVAMATTTTETGQYKVKAGDSLYSIAQKYPGYSHTDLMKLNNIKNATSLKVGQLIKVPKI